LLAPHSFPTRRSSDLIAFDPDTMAADDSAGNTLALALDEQNQQAAEIVRIQIQAQLARFILHVRFELPKRENPRQPSQRGSPNLSILLGKGGWLSGQRLQKRSASRCS